MKLGNGRVALVAGAAGIGKSALIAKFAVRCRPPAISRQR
jgi:predicted ATPase